MTRWLRECVFTGLFVALALTLAMPASAALGPNGETPKPYIIEGLVTVQFEEEANVRTFDKSFGTASFGIYSIDAVMERYSVSDARRIFPGEDRRQINSGLPDYTTFYELKFPDSIPVAEIINELQQNPNVRSAEPVWALPLYADPDDPQFTSQWHLMGLNANVRGAWDIETGSDSVIIAIVDSGVNHTHADLKDNIWINPGEDLDGDAVVFDIDDLDGIDNDGNGVVDDLIGYDFFTGITNPHPSEDVNTPDPDPNDFNGHGTHCAGIAAAVTNNGINVAGVAGGWIGAHRSYRGARIMCLRVGATGSDGNGYVNSNNCGTAIQYAARNGAKVVNCSWGSSATTPMMAAMALVDSAGITICHAAGNDGANDPDYLDYDNQTGTQTLSVASVNSNDTKASYSNWGNWIDVCAYGSSILSTYSSQYTPTVASLSGTSMAAPMVCGLAALVRSAMPSLSKYQVDSIIINTCDNIDAVNPSYMGWLGAGRINAYEALAGLASAKFEADYTVGEAPLTVQFTDLSPNLPTSWDWSFGTGDGSTDQNPSYTYSQPGLYDVSLVVDDSVTIGPGEEHLTGYIWVKADTVRIGSVIAERGAQVVVPVYYNNTVQIEEIQFSFNMQNDEGITFDSLSVEGLRTEYFDLIQINAQSTNKKYGVLLRPDPAGGGSNYLKPDTGAILNLFFKVPTFATPSVMVPIDTITASFKAPRFSSVLGDYMPVIEAGNIEILPCSHGDVNCDGVTDIGDMVDLVDYIFGGGSNTDSYGGDVDGDGGITIADLVYLVEYFFDNGPPPPN